MRIIRLDEIEGKQLNQYDSHMIMRKILMTEEASHVGVIHLPEGGNVGYHDAIVPQILIIIEGEGYVQTGSEEKVKVSAGDAVLWETGEGHETTTETGLKAIVVESKGLDVNSL